MVAAGEVVVIPEAVLTKRTLDWVALVVLLTGVVVTALEDVLAE